MLEIDLGLVKSFKASITLNFHSNINIRGSMPTVARQYCLYAQMEFCRTN